MAQVFHRCVGSFIVWYLHVTRAFSASEIEEDLIAVWAFNQASRASVRPWVIAAVVEHSVFDYGLYPNWHTKQIDFGELDKDVGREPILHDLISLLGARMQARGQQVRYLEIGVSILKCVHTQVNFFKNAVVTALDIEDPNPLVERLWNDRRTLTVWPSSEERRASGRPSDYITHYIGPHGNKVYYVAGSAHSSATYDNLHEVIVQPHGPMNLILSDGDHSEKAVLSEFESMRERGIIKPMPGQDFTMVWDDCAFGLGDYSTIVNAVMKNIVHYLRKVFVGRRVCAGTFKMNGWRGVNEDAHGVCIFSTLNLTGPHLRSSRTWVAQRARVTCDPAGADEGST